MARRKGKTLVEVFAEEQENACQNVLAIRRYIEVAEHAKELVMLTDQDAEEVLRCCDAVLLHLRGKQGQGQEHPQEHTRTAQAAALLRAARY